jgi:hypothetical protein
MYQTLGWIPPSPVGGKGRSIRGKELQGEGECLNAVRQAENALLRLAWQVSREGTHYPQAVMNSSGGMKT